LLTDDQAWSRMSEAAHRFAGQHYSRAQGLSVMRSAFERLGLPTRP
jgi:uncharacterized protein YfiM (DUF2279 family)